MLLIVTLAAGMLFVTEASAQMITTQQIERQEGVVKDQLVETMGEQVKLLQMILIRYLEAHLANLEAQ